MPSGIKEDADMSMTQAPALLLQDDFAAAAGGLAALAMGLGMMLFMMAIAVVFLIGIWKVFAKAGQPGWAALVPIYNMVVMLEIVGRPVWWIVLFFIPLVNIAIMLVVYIDLAKSFGQSILFVALMLLGGIGFLLLGYGNYRYLGPAGAASPLAAGTTAA